MVPSMYINHWLSQKPEIIIIQSTTFTEQLHNRLSKREKKCPAVSISEICESRLSASPLLTLPTAAPTAAAARVLALYQGRSLLPALLACCARVHKRTHSVHSFISAINQLTLLDLFVMEHRNLTGRVKCTGLSISSNENNCGHKK